MSPLKSNESGAAPGKIYIGISGWKYKGWRGVFYPEKLPQRAELEFASTKFNTIELNGSFYSLQRPGSFVQWDAQTPEDFTFSVKGSRYVTHMLRLRNPEAPLANFFAQGLLRFGAKLGPILWQLPPTLQFEPERLESFLALLPRTHKQGLRHSWPRCGYNPSMDKPAEQDPRVYFAAERTFLAWIRTGLGLMGVGFAVSRFGLFLREVSASASHLPARTTGLSLWSGVFLVTLGVIVTLSSVVRHIQLVRELRSGDWQAGRVSTDAVVLGLVLAALGIAMALYLTLVR